MAKNERKGGQYRKLLLEQRGQSVPEETSSGSLFFRIRFYICICLFVAYLIFDYTDASVGPINSSRICAEIEKDFSEELELQDAWSKALRSVWITTEDADSAASGSPDK